jgi:hypothetical protein
LPQPSQRPDPAARTCNHAYTAKIAPRSASVQAVGACSPTAATAAGQRGGSYSYRSLRSRPMTLSERPSSRTARSAAPDRKRRTPARGNESARKQADLPVAKSAEGTNKGQVRDSSNGPPVEGEPSTHQGNCLKPLAAQGGLRMRVRCPGSAQAMLAGRGQARKSRCGRWRGYSPAATATRTRMEVLTQVHASSQEPLAPSRSPP